MKTFGKGDMMHLKLDITGAGEHHCIATAIDEGHCPFLRMSHFGKRWTCLIFREREQLDDTNGDGTGRLLRWPECLEKEM